MQRRVQSSDRPGEIARGTRTKLATRLSRSGPQQSQPLSERARGTSSRDPSVYQNGVHRRFTNTLLHCFCAPDNLRGFFLSIQKVLGRAVEGTRGYIAVRLRIRLTKQFFRSRMSCQRQRVTGRCTDSFSRPSDDNEKLSSAYNRCTIVWLPNEKQRPVPRNVTNDF